MKYGNSPDLQLITLLVDAEGWIVGSTPPTNMLLGSEANRWQRRNVREMVVADDRSRLEELFAKVQLTREQETDICRVVCTGGALWPCTTTLGNIVGDASVARLWQIFIQPVEPPAERRENELNADTLFSSICQHSPLIVTLGTVDEGRYLQVNETFVAKTGFAREQVLGRTPTEIGLCTVSDGKSIQREVLRNARIGERKCHFRRVDGKELVWVLSCEVVTIDDQKHLLCFAHDISSEYQTRRALEAQAENLEAIFRNMPNILALVNEEGRIEKINRQAELFAGRESQQVRNLLGGEAFRCVNAFEGGGCGLTRDCSSCPIRTSVMMTQETGQPVREKTAEMTFLIDGRELRKSLLITTVPLVSNVGRRVLLSLIDTTDQSQVQKEREYLLSQLNQMQKMDSIGRLAGGVAHDLNNLLIPILGYAEILCNDSCAREKTKETAKQIVAAGLKAGELLKQLLAFSRKQELVFKTVNLSEVVNSFEPLLRRTLCEDIQLHFRCLAGIPTMKGDRGQLEQVVMNLVVNSQDAMKSGGELHITTGYLEANEYEPELLTDLTPGRWLFLSVRDTGCGMDGSILDKIYDPFFTTKAEGKGTGLGLSTVYGIVKQHQGVLTVASTPGEGSEFRIYFPVADEAGEVPVFARNDDEMRGDEDVLVVEDDHRLRELLCLALKRAGYRVFQAASGPEALRFFRDRENSCDLLLTDVVMPDMSGVELFGQARVIRPALKVLFISGYTDEIVANRGLLEDAPLLDKPFSINRLLRTMRMVLEA